MDNVKEEAVKAAEDQPPAGGEEDGGGLIKDELHQHRKHKEGTVIPVGCICGCSIQ
jgi:hypothetical protein